MPHKATLGSMATFPDREKGLESVIATIAPQLDILYIYLNEYEHVPSFLKKFKNVQPILGNTQYGNISANGKMIFLDFEHSNRYIFIFDDDILFPDNYVNKMIETLISMNNKVALCVHGSIIPDYADWYYERSVTYDCKMPLKHHMAVNLVGSGSFAYHSNHLSLKMKDFTGMVYVDLNLSISALNQGVPLLAIQRTGSYLKFLPYEGLWEKFKKNHTHHSDILLASTEWKTDNLKKVWENFLKDEGGTEIDSFIIEANIDPDFANYIKGGCLPLSHRASNTSLVKILAKSDIT